MPVFSVAETKLVRRAAISHEIVASFFAKRIARVSSREFATRRRSLARARAVRTGGGHSTASRGSPEPPRGRDGPAPAPRVARSRRFRVRDHFGVTGRASSHSARASVRGVGMPPPRRTARDRAPAPHPPAPRTMPRRRLARPRPRARPGRPRAGASFRRDPSSTPAASFFRTCLCPRTKTPTSLQRRPGARRPPHFATPSRVMRTSR